MDLGSIITVYLLVLKAELAPPKEQADLAARCLFIELIYANNIFKQ